MLATLRKSPLFPVVCVVVVALLAVGLYFLIDHLTGESDEKHHSKHTNEENDVEDRLLDDAMASVEAFDTHAPADESFAHHNQHEGFTDQNAEAHAATSGSGVGQQQLPSECYPKDVLTSGDLLPRDANSLHAQVVPSGQGALSDQNFLTAGYHIGINTVGQTLRNANRQLRSEPPNPQNKVSPWNQSTIEADINRRPLEIGGY